MAAMVTAVSALALLGYTYLGYPALVGLLARLRPRDGGPAREDVERTISVLLPVHDGERWLATKLASLLALDWPKDKLEVLVHCDGCADGSEATARALAAEPRAAGRVRVSASARRGKPAALNALREVATGELLLLTDVRQPISPGSARALARALEDPTVGCATGTLELEGEAGSGVYWRYERWIRAQESRFRGVVGMTGALAMVRRADLAPLPEDIILDDVWIPARLALGGRRVELVDGAQAFDTAEPDAREFRRKVRTLAGNYQLFARLPALLSPRANPQWLEVVSHKILRLAAPWLLLLLAAASAADAATAGPGRAAAGALLAAQAAFYAAAALGRRAGRLAGVARTFVVLNAAAVAGLGRFLAGRQRVTW